MHPVISTMTSLWGRRSDHAQSKSSTLYTNLLVATIKEETSVEEEAKKRELRDSLECSFIANEKKDQWIQENRKKLDDEYRIISLYYKYFGGISEDDDYLQELEN